MSIAPDRVAAFSSSADETTLRTLLTYEVILQKNIASKQRKKKTVSRLSAPEQRVERILRVSYTLCQETQSSRPPVAIGEHIALKSPNSVKVKQLKLKHETVSTSQSSKPQKKYQPECLGFAK
mmetsp:Transcript_19729/g.28712  ORF Transcript_19729/g.28712 Transcript_19729/m.28712 type:complete len:123 (-) Transcript_19729:58-426(-)